MAERAILSYARASAVVAKILERALGDGGKPVVVAVVDDRGDLVAYARADGVTQRSVRIAVDKAYSASLMERSTKEWSEQLTRQGRTAAAFGDPRLLALDGGVPVFSGKTLLGGVGVSGRTGEEDHVLASHGVETTQGVA